jgi:hypothetical protein
VTRREREARDHAIVAARRRGVSAVKLAETYSLTRQRVAQIVAEWDDVPSVPRNGVRVDASKEVARTLAAFEQAIEDLGEIIGDRDAPVHVRLGAITRTFDAHERRLRLMASAGFISRNLAAPLVEQEMAAWTQGVAEILRRHDVGDEVIGELVTMARQRLRRPTLVIEGEAVAA